jgi:hypothetical protein
VTPVQPISTEGIPDLPAQIATRLAQGDPCLPDIKDLRRFGKKLPRLVSLRWVGRGGKGEWRFSKKSTMTKVAFVHSAISTLPIWTESQISRPIVAYEDDDVTGVRVLEVPSPVTPILNSDFPSLSKKTTRASSSTQITLPISPISPVSTPGCSRRESETPSKLPDISLWQSGLGISGPPQTGAIKITPDRRRSLPPPQTTPTRGLLSPPQLQSPPVDRLVPGSAQAAAAKALELSRSKVQPKDDGSDTTCAVGQARQRARKQKSLSGGWTTVSNGAIRKVV